MFKFVFALIIFIFFYSYSCVLAAVDTRKCLEKFAGLYQADDSLIIIHKDSSPECHNCIKIEIVQSIQKSEKAKGFCYLETIADSYFYKNGYKSISNVEFQCFENKLITKRVYSKIVIPNFKGFPSEPWYNIGKIKNQIKEDVFIINSDILKTYMNTDIHFVNNKLLSLKKIKKIKGIKLAMDRFRFEKNFLKKYKKIGSQKNIIDKNILSAFEERHCPEGNYSPRLKNLK